MPEITKNETETRFYLRRKEIEAALIEAVAKQAGIEKPESRSFRVVFPEVDSHSPNHPIAWVFLADET